MHHFAQGWSRRLISVAATTGVIAAGLVPAVAGTASASSPVTGAAFTTVNEAVDGAGHCKNGNPATNCNIYDGKDYVWLNGGPATAYVGDGDYFFAVLEPGGQGGNDNPNDGTTKNLSDDHDAYTDRTFSVSGGTVTYVGPHDLDSNKIRLMPYADTSNPGGVYILAICSLADGYPVNPSDCKYDAFKVSNQETEPGLPLTITKDAEGTYDTTYTWTITKDVDKTVVKQSGTQADFNYTVAVDHDAGTISNVEVNGTITVVNPNKDASDNIVPVAINGVTDQLSDGTVCTVAGGGSQTLTAFETYLPYSCSLAAVPSEPLGNTASVQWAEQFLDNGALLAGGSADTTFNNIGFTGNAIDECVNVSDSYAGDSYAGVLGTACVGDPMPATFTYTRTVTGPAGTCTDFDNTAMFITNDTGATGSASQQVTLCVGADLTVAKTAVPLFKRSYTWDIAKDVDKTLVQQIGGSATFNYTVKAWQTGFTDSAWTVDGKITVTNPNDWQDVTLTSLTDVVDNGGTCAVVPGPYTVPKSGTLEVGYSCTFDSSASGTNTATATWDKEMAYTPNGSASGSAGFSFVTPTSMVNKTVTVTDSYQGALGTLSATDDAPYASGTYAYARTVPVPTWDCMTYDNTATIVETGQSAGQSVKVCGPAKTGALTMGFWQNKNGQSIISSGSSTSGVCNAGTWLRQYAPFQDLRDTATCAQVATYTYNVIKAANASGSSMNAMLKAQMLATSLDVYFSDPALGGNKIKAPAPIAGVVIDLTKICKMIDSSNGAGSCSGSYQNVSSAFGGATSLTVAQMLTYAASQSNAGGGVWYGNVKATQEMAKNAFDAINNQVAFKP